MDKKREKLQLGNIQKFLETGKWQLEGRQAVALSAAIEFCDERLEEIKKEEAEEIKKAAEEAEKKKRKRKKNGSE